MGNCCSSSASMISSSGRYHLENIQTIHEEPDVGPVSPDHEARINALLNKPGSRAPARAMAFLDSMQKGKNYKKIKENSLPLLMAHLLQDVDYLAKYTDSDTPLARAYAAEALRISLGAGSANNHITLSMLLYGLYSIREFARANHDLKPYLERTSVFPDFPANEVWRILIDHHAWDEGTCGGLRFENEPGYMAGMLDGLRCVLQNHWDNKRFNSDMLIELHDTATAGVFKRGFLDETVYNTDVLPVFHDFLGERGSQDFTPGFRDFTYVHFSLSKKSGNISRQGLEELLETNESYPEEMQSSIESRSIQNSNTPPVRLLSAKEWDPETSYLILHPPYDLTAQQNQEKANIIIKGYYDSVCSVINDDDQKIRCIAKCAQQLEQAHLFNDGNARTIGFLVVNKLLLENNMMPTMIADPNHFDGLSVDELAEEIKQGQNVFLSFFQKTSSTHSSPKLV